MPTLLDLERQMRRTLSKSRLRFTAPPYCSSIQLALFDPAVLEGPIPHEEAQAIVAEPAYWSFCWASGQVLAAFILENPERVKGKVVADIGCGSGVVAIAASMAGAREVWACDIDDDALRAAQVNAQQNNVTLQYTKQLCDIPSRLEVIAAADVLYDRDNYHLLDQWCSAADTVLLADSRMKQIPSKQFTRLDTFEARTWPDLNEFEDFNKVRIYCSP